MSKSIELIQSQIKALKSGATMFIFPIDKLYNIGIESGADKPFYNYNIDGEKKYYGILDLLPVQKGDKDIFVENTQYSFSECIDVRVVRVQDINIKDIPKIQTEMWMFDDWYNQQLKEQNINRTYEDNDYVFLVEFKK